MALRFETMDKVALFVAALLIVGGLLGVFLPSDFIIAHATTSLRARPATLIEHITSAHARFYGIAAVVGGLIISAYVFWTARTE
jgi:hypothetical protein